jgi:hypothetical protein
MRSIIELQGRIFESRAAIGARFGVSNQAIQRWKDRGLLPPAIKFGKAEFFDRDELDCRLAASRVGR